MNFKKSNQSKKIKLGIIILIIFMSISPLVAENDINENTSYDETDLVTTITISSFDRNGDLIITGETVNLDIYIGKFFPNGTSIWERSLQGANSEKVEHLLVDLDNNIILLGTTESPDFPVLNAFQETYMGNSDLFITKFDSNSGDILWSTYLGGSKAEFLQNWAKGISLDSFNNLIINGNTESEDLFIKNAEFPFNKGGVTDLERYFLKGDMFITKITSKGEPLFSTYLGSSGTEHGYVQIDHSDNIIFGGGSGGDDYPVTDQAFQTEIGGKNDGVITKFSPTGEIIWSTYIGGSGEDNSWEFLVDSQDNIIFTTSSVADDLSANNYPISNTYPTTTEAFQQSFGGGIDDIALTKFDKDGQVLWSTFFGGSAEDGDFYCCKIPGTDLDERRGTKFILDREDNIIIKGKSASPDFPMKNAIIDSIPDSGKNPYLAKFNSTGSLEFSTWLAGSKRNEEINGVQVDSENNIIVTGSTDSDDFPVLNAYQLTKKDSIDIFVSKFSPTGEFIWSTYLGGNSIDIVGQSFIGLDDNIIILGITSSSDFPTIESETSFSGSTDLILVKFNPEGVPVWSQYIGGNKDESINRFSLIHSENGDMIIIGTTTSPDITGENNTADEINRIGFVVGKNINGKTNWSKYLGSNEKIPIDNSINLLLIGISVVLLSILGFIGNVYWNSRTKESKLLTDRMAKLLVPLFRPSSSLVYLFNGQKAIKDYDLQKTFNDEIPQEIFDYKFLLQPVRLSIIKLLSTNPTLTTTELKENLGISWKELNYQIKILKKKGYIHMKKDIIDGELKSVISVENSTLSDYEDLKEILLQFLNNSPNIEKYITHAEQIKNRKSNDDLYPGKRW